MGSLRGTFGPNDRISGVGVRVEVSDGLVTLGGRVRDTSLVPVAARLARAVEGVVDVRWDPTDVETSGEGDQALRSNA
ncbi:BON domain-containing protein [Streptomyces sp. E5N91]|uniref:BON domain-containing protein n=1 Tax=Streptomyces sp. E5N91 TaxID=1851996 RepID=UPI00237B266F|nr:BON domain-containing protein [Streptomyces sp. E5N91]